MVIVQPLIGAFENKMWQLIIAWANKLGESIFELWEKEALDLMGDLEIAFMQILDWKSLKP